MYFSMYMLSLLSTLDATHIITKGHSLINSVKSAKPYVTVKRITNIALSQTGFHDTLCYQGHTYYYNVLDSIGIWKNRFI